MQNNIFSGLSIGQNLIVLDEVESTNDYLKNLLSNIKPLPEGSAIMAIHQTKGRGQRGKRWLTLPGENLTLSYLLYPTFLPLQQQFYLNIATCLGIYSYLNTILPEVYIKWPNDMYVGNKKIAGILIENQVQKQHLKSAVIGIGLNINQQTFEPALQDKVTSLKLASQLGDNLPIPEIAQQLFKHLSHYYELLKRGDLEQLRISYNERLFRKDTMHTYIIDEVEVPGKVVFVDKNGRLNVDFGQKTLAFDLHEISYKI